jgi:hypothetical protein
MHRIHDSENGDAGESAHRGDIISAREASLVTNAKDRVFQKHHWNGAVLKSASPSQKARNLMISQPNPDFGAAGADSLRRNL